MENPYGMNDRLIDESLMAAAIEAEITEYLSLCGYNRISTPVVEYYEVFSKGQLSFDDEAIYKFIDRDGSIMTLRPDMTIPCARVASTKLRNYPKPLKVFYSGNVYRVDANSTSARRELTQIGAEIFGEPNLWSDVEILLSCCDCIRKSGVKDFKIDIGHAGFFEGISEAMGLTEKTSETMKRLINDKNIVELQTMLEGMNIHDKYKQLLSKLPYMFGNSEKVIKELEDYDLNFEAEKSVSYLVELFKKLESSPYKDNINLDMSIVSSMKYYTGIIFKGYASGAAGVIVSGGRYDTLTQIFEFDCPAVGFAVYMDQILTALLSQGYTIERKDKVLIIFDEENYTEALCCAERMRQGGTATSISCYGALADVDEYMKRYEYTKIIYFTKRKEACTC